jgi:hypothetical protein
MKWAVNTDNDNPGFLNPGFSRLKNNACYARGRAGNTDERGYDYNNIVNITEIAELTGVEIKIKPQINTDEHRYIEPPSAFICVLSRLITIIHHSMGVCT